MRIAPFAGSRGGVFCVIIIGRFAVYARNPCQMRGQSGRIVAEIRLLTIGERDCRFIGCALRSQPDRRRNLPDSDLRSGRSGNLMMFFRNARTYAFQAANAFNESTCAAPSPGEMVDLTGSNLWPVKSCDRTNASKISIIQTRAAPSGAESGFSCAAASGTGTAAGV